jgi:predicted nucleotidyltransferase
MNRIDEVRRQRQAILRLAKEYGIREVRIFGSVARGEAATGSDLDVLVEFEPGRSLLDQVGFEQDLRALLSCEIDLVAKGGISPYLEERILREAVPL